MYVAVVAALLGQALIFGSRGLLIYAVAAWAIMATFVRGSGTERCSAASVRATSAIRRMWGFARLHPWQG